MNRQSLFSSGPELGNLVVNSEPVHLAWASIVDLYREVNPHDQTLPIKFKATQLPHSLTTVLTFATPPISTSNQGLVSSTVLKNTFSLFEFLCSPSDPSFSIDEAAVHLFVSAFDDLVRLKDQYVNSRPLVITGQALGGSIAALFALWLLQSTNLSTTKSLICITFGSPLIGDDSFQKAISRCPAWHSSFLHVVSDKDPVPMFFTSPQSTHPKYKPFGTFLFCSMFGCACFDDSKSVSRLLALMKNGFGSQGLHTVDYGSILENLKSKVLTKGASDLDQRITDTLEAGIAMELQTIGIRGEQNSIVDMSDHAKIKNVFDPSKKLNDVKIYMVHLEWYKKKTKKEEIGYYDSYKNGQVPREEIDVSKYMKILTKYWAKIVEEVEKKPQKEGAAFRIRWMFAGTNYRRMVEPLDIAEFYKSNSQGSYLESRPKHYRLLEEWHNLEEKKKDQQYNRREPIGMTDDSCFWAYVEEAMKSCRLLNIGDLSNEERHVRKQRLLEFEEYLMGLIENFAVSSEVFLKDSSLMKWWREYEKIIGAHNSTFVKFMRNRQYRQYV